MNEKNVFIDLFAHLVKLEVLKYSNSKVYSQWDG